jgi:hypothetical protein
MGEARFSRRTVLAAIEVIEPSMQQAALTRCLLKWSPDLASHCDSGSLADRWNNLIKFFDQAPDYCVQDGDLLANELVGKAASLVPSDAAPRPWGKPVLPSVQVEKYLRALDLDGFTVTDGLLRAALPNVVEVPEAENEIYRLLRKHRFEVALGHLDQAFANHTDGQWAAANAQIRCFLDGLLDEIAPRLDQSAAILDSGQPRRTKLAAAGFLSRDLNEWDDNKCGFVNGLVKRLHPHGSHPGLSNQDDSTFRLHVVLITARLLLNRFDKWAKP